MPTNTAGVESPSLGVERILVAEDDDALRRIVLRVLRSQGYLVEEARDGLQALARFEEMGERVDLLITDLVLPHMSGRDLAAELERRQPALKVLYSSGYTEDTIVQHGVVDAGVNFLAKSYVPTELARRVREVLVGSLSGDAA
jgi:two-component system, cell cycle sensor histidine kinase and response regulator CckA